MMVNVGPCLKICGVKKKSEMVNFSTRLVSFPVDIE